MAQKRVIFTFSLSNVLRSTTACTFPDLNLQKCSDPEVCCTFYLPNVLRNTTACSFSSLIWPAGSAPAALASLLLDPPEPQNIGKMQCDFPSFSRTCIFSLLTFSLSDLLAWTFTYFHPVWASSWLCFSICPYCLKFSFQTFFDNILCINKHTLYSNTIFDTDDIIDDNDI